MDSHTKRDIFDSSIRWTCMQGLAVQAACCLPRTSHMKGQGQPCLWARPVVLRDKAAVARKCWIIHNQDLQKKPQTCYTGKEKKMPIRTKSNFLLQRLFPQSGSPVLKAVRERTLCVLLAALSGSADQVISPGHFYDDLWSVLKVHLCSRVSFSRVMTTQTEGWNKPIWSESKQKKLVSPLGMVVSRSVSLMFMVVLYKKCIPPPHG